MPIEETIRDLPLIRVVWPNRPDYYPKIYHARVESTVSDCFFTFYSRATSTCSTEL